MPARTARPAPSLRVESFDVDALSLYHRNPRRGDVASIAESLRKRGQYRPIVVNLGTHTGRALEVLAGNHTLMAARSLRWLAVDAVTVDVTDDEAAAIVAADNGLGQLGGYDDADLAFVLQQAGDLTGTGYDGQDLVDLLALLAPIVTENDPDDVPEPPTERVSALGDVWELGPHRLIVGDSTDPDTFVALLEGRLADLIVTDPPYGVDYQGRIGASPVAGWSKAKHREYTANREKHGMKLSNDALGNEGTRALVRDSFSAVPLKPGGVYYVCAPTNAGFDMAFREGLADAGLPLRHSLVWVKDQFALGRSDYHYRHEAILYGWAEGAPHYFVDDRTQDSVWEFARPRRSKLHPTMKPTALLRRAIENSSRAGEVVVDMFAGSGSTLIAAHDASRVAAVVELDPLYADVIVRRFQEHTGILPMRRGEQLDVSA